jgi:SIKE family
MNAAMIAENQTLQHDNKQLNTLIKEYETTLETVMSLFRQRAVRFPFQTPCSVECMHGTEFFLLPLQHDVQCQELTRIREYESRIIERDTEAQTAQLGVQTAVSASLTRLSALLRSAFRELNGEGDESDPDAADWALERECELARLERENAVLRTLLGVPGGEEEANLRLSLPPQDEGRRSVQSAVREGSGIKGGPRGTVGPFGTYKKLHIS